MKPILSLSNDLFDKAQSAWASHVSRRSAALALILVYIASLVVIEMRRRGFLPPGLADIVPVSHYAAISMAFTFLLYLEVIDLVFGLASSVSRSVGKQFEIFSLILLRQSFKDFSTLPEPLRWPESPELVFHILSYAGGALLIFGILIFYYRTLNHAPITADEDETQNFIATKKSIALLLLGVFVVLGIHHTLAALHAEHPPSFFATFYTVLVFCDILIVLVSMRYCHAFPVVFRNSGFALATVVLRLALTAPDYTNAALGVGAALYVLGLNWAYNQFGAMLADTLPEKE